MGNANKKPEYCTNDVADSCMSCSKASYDRNCQNIRLLCGTTEVGDLVGWSRQKVNIYYARGKLPKPYTLVGGKRPVWTREQIEKWKEAQGNESRE